jgi:copper chaperone
MDRTTAEASPHYTVINGRPARRGGEGVMTMANESNQNTSTVLEVQGMSCPSCIRHINDALGEVDGVIKIEVSLRERIVTVQHDASAAPVGRLIETLRDEGYEPKARAAAGV